MRWNAVERGTADLAGVPREVIEHFSQRRAEILEHMAARGEHSARAAQVATLETRRRKEYDVPVDRLREEWRARAAEHGLDRFRLRRVLGQPPRRIARTDSRRSGWRDGSKARDGLTRDQSRFTRRDVLQAFAEAAPRRCSASSELERRATGVPRPRRRSSRSPMTAASGATRPASCSRSSATCSTAPTRAGAATPASRTRTRSDAALDARPTLSAEQRELVASLTRSGDGVQVVRAAAGTGKTFALGAAVEAWQRSGIPVLGCALSARAACELRDQTGIDATTIARLTMRLRAAASSSRPAPC